MDVGWIDEDRMRPRRERVETLWQACKSGLPLLDCDCAAGRVGADWALLGMKQTA